jgi:ferritin-like metal-binding protein YciE
MGGHRMAESINERLVRYLDDAWSVEKATVGMLRDMAQEVKDPSVSTLFEEHRGETEQQVQMLDSRIRALGKQPSAAKGFLNQTMAKLGDAFRSAHDEYDKEVESLMKGYATEHFEMAMYTALQSYATACGDQETARLAERLCEQERRAGEKLWPHIAPAASRAAHVGAQR